MTATLPVRVFLGLGANLGEPLAALRLARAALAQPPELVLRAVSPLYRTAPVGGPPGQPDYLNAVLEIATTLEPLELLSRCQAIEAAAGRVRGARWAARTLDIDLLLYGDRVVATPTLTLPHPRLAQRRFVLQPLCDLWPQGRLPGDSATFTERLAVLTENQRVQCIAESW